MWAAQYFHFNQPRRWINSGGLGTMGFGLPAAIGAAVACPDVPSVLLTGDGSFQMNIQELGTARQFDIPVKCVIMDNGYLGMVRQWQELFWDRRYSNVDMGSWPDWVKLAEAYGATGILLTDKTTLVDDLRAALATPGPVVVDVKVTREENTYPMIAPGRRRARNGGLSHGRTRHEGSPRASRSSRRPSACGPAASTSSRSWWRTSPAC